MYTYDGVFLGLLRVLDDLEQFALSTNDHAAISAVRESRGALEKLVNKMDSLETGFDRIAERSCKLLIYYNHVAPNNRCISSIICVTAFFLSTTLYVNVCVHTTLANSFSSDGS
jgi:hypothetical protein